MALETLREYLDRGGSDDVFTCIAYDIHFKGDIMGTRKEFNTTGRTIVDTSDVVLMGGVQAFIEFIKKDYKQSGYSYTNFRHEFDTHLSQYQISFEKANQLGYIYIDSWGLRRLGVIS